MVKKKKKKSACQCRRHGFDPWSGKIPQAAEQLSLCATTTEPVHQSPAAAATEACAPGSPCSAAGEAPAMRRPCTAASEQPRCPQPGRAPVQQWGPHSRNNTHNSQTQTTPTPPSPPSAILRAVVSRTPNRGFHLAHTCRFFTHIFRLSR